MESLYKKCKYAKPIKRKKGLPWVAEWAIELYYYKKNGKAPVDLVGDLRPDDKPSRCDLPFLTEEAAQSFCDDLQDKHDEWAHEERRLNEISQRDYAGFRALFPMWGRPRPIK